MWKYRAWTSILVRTSKEWMLKFVAGEKGFSEVEDPEKP